MDLQKLFEIQAELDCHINNEHPVQEGEDRQEMARHLKRSEAGVRGKLERMGYKFRNGVPYLDEKQIS